MEAFRRLMTVVLIAGIAAGAVLAAMQLLAIRPMIQAAEVYETQLRDAGKLPPEDPMEWQPSEGMERTGYTLIATVLLSVGYAALLFGGANLLSMQLSVREGLLLGLAGFACFALAPALGLPPKPPGVTGAELNAAQVWWSLTAAATAIAIAAFAFARGRWSWRVVGLLFIVAPHLVGAPPSAPAMTPALHDLSVRFAVLSVATQLVFWLTLGGLGGYVYGRTMSRTASRRSAFAG